MIELAVPKKREDLRKPYSFGLKASTVEKVQEACQQWGLSRSSLGERALLWYIKEIEADPSKLKEPPE